MHAQHAVLCYIHIHMRPVVLLGTVQLAIGGNIDKHVRSAVQMCGVWCLCILHGAGVLRCAVCARCVYMQSNDKTRAPQ